jgi:hypothetical protein
MITVSGWRKLDPLVLAITRASATVLSSAASLLCARPVEQADQLVRAVPAQQLPLLLDRDEQRQPAV